MVNNWSRLAASAPEPAPRPSLEEAQKNWLYDCLQRNRQTRYGRQYGFREITSIERYRSRVPLVTYEALAPWIQRMAAGDPDLLFPGAPAAFEKTGGSTSGMKLIPYSETGLRDFRNALLPWLKQIIEDRKIDAGGAYWAVSPACREAQTTAGGIPVGIPEGAYLGEEAGAAMAVLSVVPPWVGQLREIDPWRLATLYFLLRRDDLALISVWSPTFFLLLLEYLDSRLERFIALLQQGGRVDEEELAPDRAAAARLQRYAATRDSAVLWPRLKLVSCWTDAHAETYYLGLRARLPHAAFQGKGLLATEGVITVPNRRGRPVLAAESGFYEFIDSEECFHAAHELTGGETYEVVITTASGLYRYAIGDRVLCEGWEEGLPVLRFVGRSGQSSDLVGEKLTESFVAECLKEIDGFRMLVPVKTPAPRYALVVEQGARPAGDGVERSLCINPQYEYARKMGQLGPLEIRPLKGAMERYLLWAAEKGRRLGDVKIPPLAKNDDWLHDRRERVA